MKTTHQWNDLDALVIFEKEEDNPWVNFYCFEILGYSPDEKGEFTIPLFDDGVEGSMGYPSLEHAKILFDGHINWDACSAIDFHNLGHLHLCGVEEWFKLTQLLERIFLTAGELLKKGDNDEYFEWPSIGWEG